MVSWNDALGHGVWSGYHLQNSWLWHSESSRVDNDVLAEEKVGGWDAMEA